MQVCGMPAMVNIVDACVYFRCCMNGIVLLESVDTLNMVSSGIPTAIRRRSQGKGGKLFFISGRCNFSLVHTVLCCDWFSYVFYLIEFQLS